MVVAVAVVKFVVVVLAVVLVVVVVQDDGFHAKVVVTYHCTEDSYHDCIFISTYRVF